jgi:hypothetical protein
MPNITQDDFYGTFNGQNTNVMYQAILTNIDRYFADFDTIPNFKPSITYDITDDTIKIDYKEPEKHIIYIINRQNYSVQKNGETTNFDNAEDQYKYITQELNSLKTKHKAMEDLSKYIKEHVVYDLKTTQELWSEFLAKREAGETMEITEDMYDYWLGVLPPFTQNKEKIKALLLEEGNDSLAGEIDKYDMLFMTNEGHEFLDIYGRCVESDKYYFIGHTIKKYSY